MPAIDAILNQMANAASIPQHYFSITGSVASVSFPSKLTTADRMKPRLHQGFVFHLDAEWKDILPVIAWIIENAPSTGIELRSDQICLATAEMTTVFFHFETEEQAALFKLFHGELL